MSIPPSGRSEPHYDDEAAWRERRAYALPLRRTRSRGYRVVQFLILSAVAVVLACVALLVYIYSMLNGVE